MTITLVKLSSPGWQKDFPDLTTAVIALRGHVCSGCLAGDEHSAPLDFIHEGQTFVCYDPMELLGTSCGLEYTLEGDHGLWPSEDDMDPNLDRHSKRKLTESQLLSQ